MGTDEIKSIDEAWEEGDLQNIDLDFVENATLFPGDRISSRVPLDVALRAGGCPPARKSKLGRPLYEGIGQVLAYGYDTQMVVFRELEGNEMVGPRRFCHRSEVYLLDGENMLQRARAWKASGWVEIWKIVGGGFFKKLQRRKQCSAELTRRYLEAQRARAH